MGKWKARVLRVTRKRKKRYCSISGCAWRIVALVGSAAAGDEVVW